MSMSTEQAMSYLTKADDKPANEPKAEVETPSVETSVDDSKSEVKDVASPEDTADKTPAKADEPKPNDGEPKPAETKGSDDPKVAKDDKVDKKDKVSQRDYAFIREKNKRKEQKARYEARIKELEKIIAERDGLKAEHFKKEDGSQDPTAYVTNEFAKRDAQDELKRIREQDRYEQEQLDFEQNRIIEEHCFEGQELADYRDLIQTKGLYFAEALKENDPNNVVLGYLDTLQEYPIVIRELMTNMDTLRKLFRSKDPDALKYNVRVIADQILDKHHAPKTVPQEVPPTQPVQETKPTIPVIGKQISSQSGGSTQGGSLLKDLNSINTYLAKHKRR